MEAKNASEQQNNQDQSQDQSNNDSSAGSLKINKKGFIETAGNVVELLPGLKFKVELENGHEIIATLAGKMRMNRITLVMGDTVKVEMSPYDMSKGRITFRM